MKGDQKHATSKCALLFALNDGYCCRTWRRRRGRRSNAASPTSTSEQDKQQKEDTNVRPDRGGTRENRPQAPKCAGLDDPPPGEREGFNCLSIFARHRVFSPLTKVLQTMKRNCDSGAHPEWGKGTLRSASFTVLLRSITLTGGILPWGRTRVSDGDHNPMPTSSASAASASGAGGNPRGFSQLTSAILQFSLRWR